MPKDTGDPCAACGDTYEEHRFDEHTQTGGHECEVEGCECICFESGDDDLDWGKVETGI